MNQRNPFFRGKIAVSFREGINSVMSVMTLLSAYRVFHHRHYNLLSNRPPACERANIFFEQARKKLSSQARSNKVCSSSV